MGDVFTMGEMCVVGATLADLLGSCPEAEAALADSGGEVTPEVEALLARWDGMRDEKVDRYCALIRRLEAQAAELKAEERRLASARRSRERGAEELRGRLMSWIRAQGLDSFGTARNSVRVAQNPRHRIEWTRTPEELPPEYIRYRIEPDLDAARDALEAGVPLPEGFAASRGEHLRIA